MELKRLEGLHRVYDLYVWLCHRLPYAFTARKEGEAARVACGELIEEGLDQLAIGAAAGGMRRWNNHKGRHHAQYDVYSREADDEYGGSR